MVETSTASRSSAAAMVPSGDRTDVQQAEHRLELLKAVADPTRLAVLDSLATAGARCHCDLEVELGLAANRLSFHLKVLKRAGLVSSKRSGRRVRYFLTEGALDAVRAAVPILDAGDHPVDTCTACPADDLEAAR